MQKQLKYLLLAFALIAGCGTVETLIDRPHVVEGNRVPPLYSQALAEIENGKYAEARANLELFLSQNPVSLYSQVALFNIGYTLELERSFKEAGDKYREVALNTVKSAPRLQAYALYRLSYCLEALGDDAQVVAVLTDVNERKQLLAPEVANAELPARLAAAYSRVGNTELAQKLYSEAASSLTKYRRQQDKSNRPAWLAKTLYHMGRSNLREANWENFEVVVRPLAQAQDFLLEAAELDDPQWSNKASQDLANVYNGLWNVIRNPPDTKDEDEVLKQRAAQQRQWEMTFQLVDLLDDLKRHRLAELNSTYVQNLFIEVDKLQKQIKKLLAQQKVGSDLTPAARKRILGHHPSSKLPAKTKTKIQTLPPPPPAAATPEVDPNL